MDVKVRKGYAFRRGNKAYEEGATVDITDEEFRANSWKFHPFSVEKVVENKSVSEELVNNRAMGITNAAAIVNRGRVKNQ